MEDVRIEKTSITQRAEFENIDIEKHKTQMFSMFGGEIETVELEFTGDMLDDIYDRFGENIKVQKTGDDTYRVFAQIQISPTFFSWVVGSCGKMRIVTPTKIKDQFNMFVGTMMCESFHDMEIALYDIDGARLEESYLLIFAMNQSINEGRATVKKYLGVEQRREALRNADFVVNATRIGLYDI